MKNNGTDQISGGNRLLLVFSDVVLFQRKTDLHFIILNQFHASAVLPSRVISAPWVANGTRATCRR